MYIKIQNQLIFSFITYKALQHQDVPLGHRKNKGKKGKNKKRLGEKI